MSEYIPGKGFETFELSDSEKRQPLWLKLANHLKSKLSELRGRNDGPLDADETATLRGQIRCLKGLLALGEDKPPVDG